MLRSFYRLSTTWSPPKHEALAQLMFEKYTADEFYTGKKFAPKDLKLPDLRRFLLDLQVRKLFEGDIPTRGSDPKVQELKETWQVLYDDYYPMYDVKKSKIGFEKAGPTQFLKEGDKENDPLMYDPETKKRIF